MPLERPVDGYRILTRFSMARMEETGSGRRDVSAKNHDGRRWDSKRCVFSGVQVLLVTIGPSGAAYPCAP
jgi:hypothetical protein